MLKLDLELSKISGVGEKFLKRLDKLSIKTVRDLLWHFPFRYEDYSKIVKIADLKINQPATIRGVVRKVATRRTWKRKMLLVEAVIVDETGGVSAIWFNQPYIAQVLKPGREANFAGRAISSQGRVYLSNPTYETISNRTVVKHTAGLIPIYPETKSLTSRGLRYLIEPILNGLEKLEDFVPEEILEEYDLPEVNSALHKVHFPRTMDQAEKSRKRFAFEDLFLLQLNNLRVKRSLLKEKAPALKINAEQLEAIIKSLPFELTGSQRRSLDEIISDLSKLQPMNRLLQGDVGSGKTVVAAVAAFISALNNKQAAFMAPTEVLARQHYKTLMSIFKNLDVSIGLLTGSEARAFYSDNLESKKTKFQLLKEISSGQIKVIVGTHAVIQKSIVFQDLALAIIDEQHRFGVEQRAALVKKELNPGEETTIHFLSMGATPIPRTLSLTLFGDLDLSIIDELPIGRKPIITKIVSPANRNKAYAFIREQIKSGRQAFVICPRIVAAEVETEESGATIPMIKKRKDLWQEVTSVIEVGVDVPNATIMMIEGADRFGLAQLYQFRGRVGRAEHQSYCLLFTDSESAATQQRLNALIKAKNGFELAEIDLKLRGPGQFLCDKQTGLPDLAMRSLNNIILVREARSAAVKILEQDQELIYHPMLAAQLGRFEKNIHLE